MICKKECGWPKSGKRWAWRWKKKMLGGGKGEGKGVDIAATGDLIRAGKISEEKRWRLTRTWQATRILASFPPLTHRSTTGLFLPIGPLIKFGLPKCCQGQILTHRLLIGRGYDRPRQSPHWGLPLSLSLLSRVGCSVDIGIRFRLWSTITSCPPLIG